MLNLLNFAAGWMEGRAIADVRDIRNLKIAQLQMEFDALPEDAKERVRAAQIERQRYPQPEPLGQAAVQGFVKGFKIGIFLLILLFLFAIAR